MRQRKVVVMIPTFNEAENIGILIDGLYGIGIRGLEVLVVDDNSPDGTSTKVEELIASGRHHGLGLITRLGAPGRGWAGREGFLEALIRGAEVIVEMDGDLSHQPRHVPELLAALESSDIVIGSRFVGGGSDLDRGRARRAITVLANGFARVMLGMPVLDCNSGFRAFRREAMEAIEPETLKSRGPSIVHEVLVRAKAAGLRFKEVPIEFQDRKKGVSKLDFGRLVSGYLWVLKSRLFGR